MKISSRSNAAAIEISEVSATKPFARVIFNPVVEAAESAGSDATGTSPPLPEPGAWLADKESHPSAMSGLDRPSPPRSHPVDLRAPAPSTED